MKKKIVLTILLISMILPYTALAEESEIKTVRDTKQSMNGMADIFHEGIQSGYGGEYYYVYDPIDTLWYSKKKLVECGILSKEEIDDKICTEPITRRDILKLLISLKEPFQCVGEIANTKEEAKEIIELFNDPSYTYSQSRLEVFGNSEIFDFEDIKYEDDDFLLAYKAYAMALTRGKESEGKRYLNLNDNATYGETVTMVCRLFLSVPYFNEDDAVALMKEMGYTDNFMFHFAEKINLINSDNLLDISTPELTMEQWNETISREEFYWLLYRALYVPVFGTFDFGTPFYYINNYMNVAQ